MVAIAYGHEEVASYLWISSNVAQMAKANSTILYYAAKHGNNSLARAACERKIHINTSQTTRPGNYTALHLATMVIQLGTSKKLNSRYQGPFRVSKVFPNHTVEIRAYNGNGTQLTHVNCLKALTECMIWRDEECVDFDDLRESKLRATRLREEDFDNEEDLADGEAGDEVNSPDHEGDRELIDLDAVAPNDDRDAHFIDFDPLIYLNQTATEKPTDTRSNQIWVMSQVEMTGQTSLLR
ncbi:hypothetical protein OUZ56_032827 [Daphnia magna]|uniref:Uncharacterized protein n=1 Tax=Daphnia magna TaxID=35525 RepID=A0ABR0B9P1_9CRUS|nr:hypothetical protein OUZ56_032827 [Daphnia magna]